MMEKRRKTVKLLGHDGGGLYERDVVVFIAKDIDLLVRQMDLPPALSRPSNDSLADSLNNALVFALILERRNKEATPITKLSASLSDFARVGRDLLLSLGIDAEPSQIVNTLYRDILKQSLLLRFLVREAPYVELLEPMLSLHGPYEADTVQNRNAAWPTVINTLRGLAFSIIVADTLRNKISPKRPRGPKKSIFGNHLLEELIFIFHLCFGHLPHIEHVPSKYGGEIWRGTAFEWVRTIIDLAIERLEFGHDRSKANPALLLAIRSLAKNKNETLGRKIWSARQSVSATNTVIG